MTDAPPARSSRPLVAALVLATLFGLAELPFAAFMADDLIQLSVLERVFPAPWMDGLHLYTLSDGAPEHVRAMLDAGPAPWFFGPSFRMAFFRPLSSGLLALDHAVWGLWPVGYRLHGVAWFLLLVAGFGLVLRRTLPGPTGAFALLLYVLSGVHGMLVWTAARHVVVAGALGMLALAAHVAWRADGWRPGRALSLAGFVLAFAASEAALGVAAYLVAYEALAASGRPADRLRAIAPALALFGAYLVLFALGGYGASGGGYLDPFRAPVAFVRELPARWTFLMGALVGGGNADVWVLRPDLRAPLTIVAAVLVAAFGFVLRAAWRDAPDDERRGVAWLVAGAAMSALPFAGSPLGSRCLVLPMLGGSVAVAFVLRRWWTVLRARPHMRIVSGICAVLAFVHLVQAPVQRLVTPYLLRSVLHDRLVSAMDDVELDATSLATTRVIVLHAPDLVIGLHAFFFRALQRMPMPYSWRTLSWARGAHRFTRTATDTIEMDVADGIDAPTLATDVVEMDGMRAEVLTRGPRGPTRVAFRFDRPLDDPGLWFLAWRDGRLRHVAAPAVGQDFPGSVSTQLR